MERAFENTVTFAKKINKFYNLVDYMGVLDEAGRIVLCHAKDQQYCSDDNSFWNKVFVAKKMIRSETLLEIYKDENGCISKFPTIYPETSNHNIIISPDLNTNEHKLNFFVILSSLGGQKFSESPKNLGIFSALCAYFELALIREKNVEQLEEKIHMLNAVIENFPYCITVVDKQGKIILANENALHLPDDGKTHIIGEKIDEFIQNDDPYIYTVLKGGSPIVDKPVVTRNKNNSVARAIRTCLPVKGSDGKIIAAIDIFQDLKVIKTLADRYAGNTAKYSFGDIIYSGEQMKKTIAEARRASETFFPVLIESESGTGKELFAHAIHRNSPKREGPFVIVDCSAIQKELAESELFGYVEGAFTGSSKGGKIGKLEIADGGTLFLDEIGELPLHLQVKLLRFLQEKTFVKVGDTNPISVNVRIIAATNRDLENEILKRNFREDLYYRLNVFKLRIPPLRERREDIILLAEYFIHKYEAEFGKTSVVISKDTKVCMMNYDWPGNVRELENDMIRALALCDKEIMPIHLPFYSFLDRQQMVEELIHIDEKEITQLESADTAEYETKDEDVTIVGPEASLKKVLESAGWNLTKAAKMLNISRQSMYNRINKDEDAELILGILNKKKNITAEDIYNAIENCNGNKSLAAKQLGISRKNLYNKLQMSEE